MPGPGDRGARSFLFTGFPGFLGTRLLPRLLELRPAEKAICLVQAKFLGMATGARDALEARQPACRGRIELVIGDIRAPDLGLADGVPEKLRTSLVEAYHLAAVYDLAVRRDVSWSVNVEGTRHLLRFLSDVPGFRRLHHVSTAYVSGTARGTFRETDLDVGQGFKNHYEETKFRAEVEVAASAVPHTVYRPGIVVGDSETGETGKFDGPYFVLRAMERLPSPGVFPRFGGGGGTVNIVPVDFVVEGLARLSVRPSSLGRTYHLCDPRPHAPRELVELFARAFGRRYVQVPLPLALGRLAFASRGLQRFFGMPAEVLDYFDDPVRHDASVATRELAELGIECPRLTTYVTRLVAFYRARRDQVRQEAMV